MNNPMQFMSILKDIKNPKEAVLNAVKGNNNPMIKNIVEMAEKNDIKGLENFTRNIMKEQGRDFDSEVNEFMKYFK